MKRQLRLACALSLVSAFAVGQSALASGFEKSIMFGGETSGVAGIATSYMEGSQALYFNPAGLVSSKADGKDVSLNISPTMLNYSEAFDTSGNQVSSNHTLVPFSLMYGQTIGDKFGYGIGVYTSGGGYGDFTSGNNESKLDLSIYEASLGFAYKITENLKIGAAWRVAMVNGALDVQQNIGQPSPAQANVSGLTDTQWGGWRLGAQYKIADRWDLGLTYRSEIDFHAKGTMNFNNASSDATVGTDLPAAWTLGTSFYVADTWRMFAEYAYTQYSSVTNLAVNSGLGATPIQLSFLDQHNVRVAAEYKGWSWPVRFGYIFTSQVTDQAHTLPGLTPPGTANTVTVGTGQSFTMGGQAIRIDGGLEYTWLNGSSNATAATPPAVVYTAGSNNLNEIALHLGAVYSF